MTTLTVHVRSQVPDGVLAIGSEPVRLTWRVAGAASDERQEAYEVEAAADGGFERVLASSGTIASPSQVGVVAPGEPLRSREVRFHRVRIRTEGGWTDWSAPLRVEAGLLEAADWEALAITLPDDPGRERQAPSPVLRREFVVTGDVRRARLHATALGLHDVRLNGEAVSDELLAPGWTPYDDRLLADTYDVTSRLRPGANVVVARLGDGWYRGRLGWKPGEDRCHYGRDVALIAQLEWETVDGESGRLVTDGSWSAATGEIRSADLYDGSVIDLRERLDGIDEPGADLRGWQPVAIVPFDPRVIEPRVAPPVRVVERWDAVLPEGRPHDGVWRLDAGQNISGYLRLRVRGERGDRVIVRHAEVLEPDGSLHTRALRSARATDAYVLADDAATDLAPVFTFHGFRHAEIVTTADVLGAEVIAISSDTPRRGSFACSDARLTRLHENVVWSQRDNFVSVPTDCPQRDERLGWTGDAQAFAPTASTLFDAEAFWTSWLRDLAIEQDDVLGVPSVVPDVVVPGGYRFGRAGWADAATIVPWAVFESYGDATVLARQLPSMRRWLASLSARQGPGGLLGPDVQFGDWLDPDAPIDRPWEAKTDPTFLANAFFAHSARLTADAAELLGDAALAAEARTLAMEVGRATWERWARHAVTTQTGCAVALRFGLVPDGQRVAVADALADLVRSADGRVATGFLGTPLVLPALADAGRIDEAYHMLMRTEMPSWLYQVVQGATTVWERWDAILPDGSIHPGTMTTPPDMPRSGSDGAHMLSFNHYAYGAVIDWVYRHVAGLAPDVDEPGYRHVLVAPQPLDGMSWARASVESRYGTVSIDWRIEVDGVFHAEIGLPFGTTATFVAPVTDGSVVELDGRAVDERIDLGPGRHSLTVTQPRLARRAHSSPAPASSR
jgi:alpha-L-rhamnosidase